MLNVNRMTDPTELLKQALDLDATDRARIAQQLIASLEADEPGAEELWRAEIRRRLDTIEDGSVQLEEWDEVRQRLRRAAEG
jgi:putative addiction module component (TIGR02574 family)